MESAATVEEEKSNLKERMEAYREQMDAVKQYLSTSTYKPGSNAVTKKTIRNQAKTHSLKGLYQQLLAKCTNI